MLLGDHCACPTSGGCSVVAELRQIQLARDAEIVIAGEHDRRTLADALTAFVRARAIAHNVPEAPDLVRLLGEDVVEHRVECVKIGVDV